VRLPHVRAIARKKHRRSGWRWLALLAFLCGTLHAAEVIPPAPRDHFNDQAGIVARATAEQLNAELTQFERDTSNQIVVAIFPKMQSDSSIEDYTVRVFQAWGVGRKGTNNGAVLFIFRDDRKVRIVTGYGLEGAIPDATAKRIIENEITPRFRNGDFTGGVAAGTRALMAAARGEYRGTGRTVADGRSPVLGSRGLPFGAIIPFFVFLMILLSILRRIFGRRNVMYGGRGRRNVWVNNSPWWWGGGGGGGFGGGGGSSWGSGGGGGSFSGGGGSTGGGGAGGSW
jgi:uncharacterized protein